MAAKRASPRTAKRGPAKPKAGRSAHATAERRKLFVEAYLRNGQNATDAAIRAGYSERGAKRQGWQLLQDPEVKHRIEARARHVAEAAEMTTENWARELRAIAFADPADAFDELGGLLAVKEMPRRLRRALASIKTRVEKAEGDEEPALITEIKFWNKVEALVTMARHLGLFEKDNSQLAPNIRVQVELLG